MKTPKCTSTRHSWRRALWGYVENHGAILTADICRHCGMQRSTVLSYCGRTRNNRTTYRAAGES